MIDFIRIPEERLKNLKRNEKQIKQLEHLAEVKIKINEEISFEGKDSLMLLRVKEVLKAFGRGFEFDDALYLLDESYYLETIYILDYCKSKKRMTVLKSRVIGTKGKTKKLLEQYTETKIAIYGKTISIIGKWNNIMQAKKAVEMILFGSSHNTVYRFLEQHLGEENG